MGGKASPRISDEDSEPPGPASKDVNSSYRTVPLHDPFDFYLFTDKAIVDFVNKYDDMYEANENLEVGNVKTVPLYDPFDFCLFNDEAIKHFISENDTSSSDTSNSMDVPKKRRPSKKTKKTGSRPRSLTKNGSKDDEDEDTDGQDENTDDQHERTFYQKPPHDPFDYDKEMDPDENLEMKVEEKRIEAEKSQVKEESLQLARILETVGVFEVKRKVGEGKQILGSVTAQDLVDIIKAQLQRDINTSIVSLPEIQETGEYIAELKLHPDVSAQVRLNVSINYEA